MPFILVLIGGVLVVAAFRNTQGNLATALEADVPGFFEWFLALAVIGGLGFVPGLKVPSRMLLALVLVVLVVTNYTRIFSGFSTLATSPPQAGTGPASQPSPAAAYVANPANPQITSAEISGTSTGNINAASQTATVTSPLGAFDPAAYLTAFEAGVGGFGGIA